MSDENAITKAKAPYTSILLDKSKFNLGALDLFDKVINLKITTLTGDEYVIRSDYETYFPDASKALMYADTSTYAELNKCYIRKCQYKPSLKVQYKRVSLSTPVAIDIYAENFYMLDKQGKVLRSFNNITNKIIQVDLQMGYFGQFKRAIQGDGEASQIPVSKLFDFNPDNFRGHGITTIQIRTEYVQTDKLPPDMTIHIHGFVGNFYASELKVIEKQNDGKYAEVTKKEDVVINTNKINKRLDSKTVIGQLFFNCVTKNWLRSATNIPEDIKKQLKNPEDIENPIIADTLSDEDALAYGVLVYFSKTANKLAQEYDETLAYDTIKVKISSASTASAKLNLVLNALGIDQFRAMPLSTGDYLIYTEEDMTTPSKVLEESKLSKIYEKEPLTLYWEDKLPAVYNITTDALCTIVCPFFFFINPFQKFYFKSAYALGGLVSYYAKYMPTEDVFYALWQNISFATVEDVNECMIVCIGEESGK